VLATGLLSLSAARAAGPAARAGSLYTFGFNKFGELGISAPFATATPTLVSLPGEIGTLTQVAAGGFHSLAVTSSGQLYGFGSDQGGQLGTPGIANSTPTLVTLPGESGKVTQVAGGYEHTLVVTSAGQLYAFGLNESGELGNTTHNGTLTANPTPKLVTLPGLLHSASVSLRGERGNAMNDGRGKLAPTRTPITLRGRPLSDAPAQLHHITCYGVT
jgi:hypothetical protein